MKHRLASPLALASLALVALTGCPPAGTSTGTPTTPVPQGEGGDLDAIKARGKLVVAMDVGYDPFETLKTDGTYQGFDVDLANEIASDLGVTLELKRVDWVAIIPELRTGKVDAILSGMSVTDERKQVVTFSEPYFNVGQVVIKKKGDARISSWRDLDADGMRVATQEGTTGEQAIRKKMPKATCMPFPKTDEACVNLLQGKCDAVVFDLPFLFKYVTEQTKELEGIWEPFSDEAIAVACRQESAALVTAINATLKRLRDSGKHAELVARWFPGLPGGPGAQVTPPGQPAGQ